MVSVLIKIMRKVLAQELTQAGGGRGESMMDYVLGMYKALGSKPSTKKKIKIHEPPTFLGSFLSFQASPELGLFHPTPKRKAGF